MFPRDNKLKFVIGFLIFLTFDLMLLGAGVRALNAGLTCPDWPLCFGQAIPKYHFGVYLEFIHRAIAGILFIIYFVTLIVVVKNKEASKSLKKYFWIGFFILISQVIMGGLTVLALLKSGIVTLHLVLAACFLINLVLIQFEISTSPSVDLKSFTDNNLDQEPRAVFFFRCLALLLGLVFLVQFILGGLVASTYAGKLCLDFPLCNGQWVPTLAGPLGLQVIHRFSAYLLAVVSTGLFLFSIFSLVKNQKAKILSGKIFLLVLSQIMVGILNLKLIIPAWLTVIHLGLALLILLSITKLIKFAFS